MSKILDYLKVFFMFEEPAVYEATEYKDYDGLGFSRYKSSDYFLRGGKLSSSYTKREVAAFSEMTKLALLTGMTILTFMVLWFDYIVIDYTIFSRDWHGVVVLVGFIGLLPLNTMVVSFWPRVVFILKNFKVMNG